MSDQDFEYLKKFELNFTTALESNYSRAMLRSEYEEVIRIYNKVTGESYKTNLTCSHCCLKLLQKVGRLYFDESKCRNECQDEHLSKIPETNKTKKPNKLRNQIKNKKSEL